MEKRRSPSRKGCELRDAQYSPGRRRKKNASQAMSMVARCAGELEAVAAAWAWRSS